MNYYGFIIVIIFMFIQEEFPSLTQLGIFKLEEYFYTFQVNLLLFCYIFLGGYISISFFIKYFILHIIVSWRFLSFHIVLNSICFIRESWAKFINF